MTAPEDAVASTRRVHPSVVALVVGLVAAVPVLLHVGRHQWFFLDEWDFLASRSALDPGDLFEPHNEHWTTLPLVAYRVMYSVVGLHDYWPYQLMVISLHLVVAAELWALIRRARVGPWLAMALVAPFVLFGSGVQNILWAFQISFVGALAAGFGHLLLADRDETSWERRDWVGLGVGALGLLCSGLAVPLTIGVGAAVWIRRGLPMALRHTMPLGAVYLVWWVTYGRDGYRSDDLSPDQALEFAGRALWHTVRDVGRLGGGDAATSVGWLVALVVVGGIGLWVAERRSRWRAESATAIGCTVALVTLLLLTGLGRAEFGVPLADQSRYSHVVLALALPAIGLAAAGYGARISHAGWVVAAVLVVGLPGNVAAFTERGLQRQIEEGRPELVLALPRIPEGETAAADARPLPTFGFELTMGWLREATADGQVPQPDTITDRIRTEGRFRLAVVQREGEPEGACVVLDEPQALRLEVGDEIGVRGGLVALVETATGTVVTYFPDFGGRLVADQGPLDVEISPQQEIRASELCLAE